MDKKSPDFKRSEQESEKIIEKNYITFPPINLQEIVEEEGLSLAVAEFGEQNISGFIDFEKKMIIANKYDSDTRQRFTIAHELGHWILHQKEINEDHDIVVLYRRPIQTENDPLEQEANCFAANLLVPKKFLKEFIKKKLNSKQIANIFGVSESVISFRYGFMNG